MTDGREQGMTSDDLERLEQVARSATDGPWESDGVPYDGVEDPMVWGADGSYVCQTTYDMQSVTQKHDVDADTRYIATFDPPTVLALIYRALRTEAKAELLEGECDAIGDLFSATSNALRKAERVVEAARVVDRYQNIPSKEGTAGYLIYSELREALDAYDREGE